MCESIKNSFEKLLQNKVIGIVTGVLPRTNVSDKHIPEHSAFEMSLDLKCCIIHVQPLQRYASVFAW